MANVHVNVDLSGLNRKLSPARFKVAKNAMANQILLDMNRFVPKRDEWLRGSGYVNSKGNIEYAMIYARAQFFGMITAPDGSQHPVHHYTTPGTSKRWDLKATAQYSERWAQVLVRGLALGR